MTSCNLTKPESTFDSIRKTYKDLKPTDVALVATALVQAGKFADCVYDGQVYAWNPNQHEALTRAYQKEVEQVQQAETGLTKAKAKVMAEETVTLTCHLRPSMAAAERILGRRKDLITMVSDILSEGVEFLYSPTDLGWPWTLERVNWSTVSGGELMRRIKFQAEFEEPCAAVELAQSGKRKKR